MTSKIITAAPGYRITMDADDLDSLVFARLVREARAASAEHRWEQAVSDFRSAERLWRGEALAGLTSDALRAAAAVLEAERISALEDCLDLEIHLGRAGDLVGEVIGLIQRNPLRERLHGALMRALYRDARQGEALEVFRQLHRRLRDELGVEPSPAIAALHQRILRGEEHLEPARPQADLTTSASSVPPTADPAVPQELPADVAGFTGRGQELAILDNLVPERENPAGPVVISAIDGMAGIGKTALAVHAAHQLADRYPHGQLFVDLHGYTQGLQPLEAGEVLERILRTLGIPGERIPADLDERAALYRSRLADQQLLIVLDNAATETQITPLLPGSPSCLVLVTSRRRLTGLDATRTLSLDTLPLADAVTLFTRTAGVDRLAHEPSELVAEVVELCGRLPPAIRIAAARLRSHPSWNLTHLVGRLRNHQHRLAELDTGQRSITAALELSYQQLTPHQQHMYRLLGLHPGPDIEPYAAAALTNTTLNHATHLLEQLHHTHLLQEPTPNRYRFHDLARAHATHTAITNEPEPNQLAALTRLLDHYRHTTSTAMNTTHPSGATRRPRVPTAATPTPNLPNPARATAWLDAELPNLLAAARHAANNRWPEHIWHLSTVLNRHLRTCGRFRDAETLHHQALAVAQTTGNRTGELDALNSLGHIHLPQGHHQQASGDFEKALEIARATGHRNHEIDALTGLGYLHRMQGQLEQARDDFTQILEIVRITGDRNVELNALIGLGHIHRQQGQHQRALYHFERALEIARIAGSHIIELNALNGLGKVYQIQGRHREAIDHCMEALEIARDIGHRLGELDALAGLGDVHRLTGGHVQAADYYHQVLDLAREINSRNLQLEAFLGLGLLHYARGHPETALGHHHQALELATDLQQPGDQARAHNSLALAHRAINQHQQARQHWQQALDILTNLGIDYADDGEPSVQAIRSHLANLEQQQNHRTGTARNR